VSPHRNNLFDQFIRRRRSPSCKHRSRSSSLQSVKESKIDEDHHHQRIGGTELELPGEPANNTMNGGFRTSFGAINGVSHAPNMGTTSTQTTVLLDLE